MIILLACLGSFVAGIAVGMLITYCWYVKAEKKFYELFEKELNKYNLTLDK